MIYDLEISAKSQPSQTVLSADPIKASSRFFKQQATDDETTVLGSFVLFLLHLISDQGQLAWWLEELSTNPPCGQPGFEGPPCTFLSSTLSPRNSELVPGAKLGVKYSEERNW